MKKSPSTGKGAGRHAIALSGKGEALALGAYLKAAVEAAGGRRAAAAAAGVSLDTVINWTRGATSPSAKSLDALIAAGIIPHASIEAFAADAPWLAPEYRVRPTPEPEPEPAPNPGVAPEPQNLMTAILAEPGLSVRQRATLAAVVALVTNGVEVDISISPRVR